MTKEEKYKNLVIKRKKCDKCVNCGLINPSQIEDGKYDANEIGPWTRWQGSLDADIMIVGQDWGSQDEFIKMHGLDRETNRTDQNIMVLLKELGVNFTFHEKSQKLYFTNAALCIREGGAQGNLNNQWLVNCRSFLKEQIDIIQPKVIIVLGQMTHKAVLRALEINTSVPSKFSEAIKQNPVKYENSLIFPVYHPGALGLLNRKADMQKQDWERVNTWIKNRTKVHIDNDSSTFDNFRFVNHVMAIKNLLKISSSFLGSPLTSWNEFDLPMGKLMEGSDDEERIENAKTQLLNAFKIEKQDQSPSGLYALYNQKNECLYIGKGKNLVHRLLSHFKASLAKEKVEAWKAFFTAEENQVIFKARWIGIKYDSEEGKESGHTGETLRIVLERLLLNNTLVSSNMSKPTFEVDHPSEK